MDFFRNFSVHHFVIQKALVSCRLEEFEKLTDFFRVFFSTATGHTKRALSVLAWRYSQTIWKRRASVAFCCCLNSKFDDDALLSYHWSGVAKKAKLFLTLGQLWKLFFYLLDFMRGFLKCIIFGKVFQVNDLFLWILTLDKATTDNVVYHQRILHPILHLFRSQKPQMF